MKLTTIVATIDLEMAYLFSCGLLLVICHFCSLLVMKITLCYYFVEKFASFPLHKLLVIYCKNKKSLQYFLIIDYKNSFFTLCENCLLDFAKVVLFSFESQFLQVSWCKIAVYSSQNILIMLFFDFTWLLMHDAGVSDKNKPRIFKVN